MIVAKFNSSQFAKEMNNLMEYSAGFLTGVQRGKIRLLEEVGEKTKEILGQYLDSNARVNPELLHHVYEWYRTGSPEARLFNLNYNAAAGLPYIFQKSNGGNTGTYEDAQFVSYTSFIQQIQTPVSKNYDFSGSQYANNTNPFNI
jgi:hypothetical protein